MPKSTRKFSVRRALVLLLSCGSLVLACSPLPHSARQACSGPAEIVQIAAGVYVRPGHSAVVFEDDEIANIGFVVGDNCVAVIDTGGSAAEGQALNCAVHQVTARPVCFVINTHVHPDHLLGNVAFQRSGVQFIGHEKLPRALALRGDTYIQRASVYQGTRVPDSDIVAPDRTVNGVTELDLGGRVLSLRAHRSAHTDHDLTVIDSKTRTAFVGDLVFLGHLPVIDGSIGGWIGELEALTGESFNYVVPGHGPARTAWPAAAAETLRYLTELRENVRMWLTKGGDLPSAQDNIGVSNSSDWLLLDRYHKRNVGAAYAELEWED